MEHTNEENLYSERYLLGELSAEEQEAFEEHFFNCQTCGEDVFTVARMLAVRERIAKSNLIAPPRSTWRRWVPQAAAASILSASLGWWAAVQYVGSRAAAVQPPPAMQLTSNVVEVHTSEERGRADTSPKAVEISDVTIIPFTIPARDDAERYVVTVYDPAGTSILSKSVDRPEAAKYQNLVVYRALPRGNYRIVIEGVRKGGIRFLITDAHFVVGES